MGCKTQIEQCALTPRLTGAGARSAEGTAMGHQNREAMAHGGVRVEPTVRPHSLPLREQLRSKLRPHFLNQVERLVASASLI
jgi:hypothetical protein